MTFRILHTADWQIGMRATHAGTAAPAVRAARISTARRVIEIANERGVDVVILAGDTFEDSSVSREVVREVVDVLRASVAPVLVLPGNHDPLVPQGVFDHLAWVDAAPKVRVLRDRSPLAIGAAVVFPCPLRRANSVEDPIADLPDPTGPRNRIRVGVAHGSLLGAAAPAEDVADDFPIDRAHAERAWLDYLALGHWHVHSVQDAGGAPRIAYSGTHEPTKYGETGGCLVVTIDAPGSVPTIEHVACAAMAWRRETVALGAPGDLEQVRRRVDAEPAESRTRVLFDLELEGAVSVAEHERLADLAALLAARFLHARLRRDGLRVRPEGDAWIEGLPAGAPRATARELMALATKEGRDAEVAARALGMLFEIAGAPAS